MGQRDDTKKREGKKPLTERERYQLEILLKEGRKPREIGALLSRDRRTIEREIGRGTVEQVDSLWRVRRVYCADAGQRVSRERASKKGRPLKLGKDHALASYLEQKIGRERYSPEAALAQIARAGLVFDTKLSVKTVYNYIDQGVFLGISNADLPVKRARRKRGYRWVRRVALNNVKGRSIEERPQSVKERKEYGHWKMDCVVGKGKACLLVLTERASRQEMIFKLPAKTQTEVVNVLDRLERRYKGQFYAMFSSITMDNGTEFLNMKALERSCLKKKRQRTVCYYAHPYSSWERGSNEVNNRLIRRFVPKGADIGKITQAQVKHIESWMNNYPRRQFAFRSAFDVAADLFSLGAT